MKFQAGLIFFAAYLPYMVWADAAAAASAAASSSSYSGGSSSAAAAAAAAAASSSPGRTVRCRCTEEYNPVCGTDGYTYSNACILKCVSDDNAFCGLPAIAVYRYGQCPTISCNCTKIKQPICGSNNQTYANECIMNCENNVRIGNGLKSISIAYRNACMQPTCVCPDSIIPVCGTDGKTYKNVCILECYSRINRANNLSPICVAETGACKNETCTCALQKEELCASDENTYFNDCTLECQNRRRNQLAQDRLTIQYRGKCFKCQCPADYSPVCAKDRAYNDYTFSNYCQFLCHNKKLKAANQTPLILRWGGPCDCGCSKKWIPVCATNNKTYQNRCGFRCNNRKRLQDKRLQLGIKYNGVCKKCNCDYCGNKYKPLCGSDLKTYWNPCWLQCSNDCRPPGHKISKICDGEC